MTVENIQVTKDSYIRFRTTKRRKKAALMLAAMQGKTLTAMYEDWLDEKINQNAGKQPTKAKQPQ